MSIMTKVLLYRSLLLSHVIAPITTHLETSVALAWKNLGWSKVTLVDLRNATRNCDLRGMVQAASVRGIAVGFKQEFWSGSPFGDSPCHLQYVSENMPLHLRILLND